MNVRQFVIGMSQMIGVSSLIRPSLSNGELFLWSG
jgi:hypothetical protein